jgi:hypothetical protein
MKATDELLKKKKSRCPVLVGKPSMINLVLILYSADISYYTRA